MLKQKLITTQYTNRVGNKQDVLGKPSGFQLVFPHGISVINQKPRHMPLPESNYLEIQPLLQALILVSIHIPTQKHIQYGETSPILSPLIKTVGDSNIFAWLGYEEELNDDEFEWNFSWLLRR